MDGKVTKYFILIFTVIVLGAGAAVTQTPMPFGVPEILEKAELQSQNYVSTFTNLIADETKIFQVFNRNGTVKKQRIVISNFFVYQPAKVEGRVAEFRNIQSVDGKLIDNIDGRAQDFFSQIVKADTADTELDRIREESVRHDLGIAISGLTLYQAVSLWPEIRANFDFHLDSEDQIDGRKVFIIGYQQKSPTDRISVNTNLNKALNGKRSQSYEVDVDKEVPLNARLNGIIVIDAADYRLIKETRRLTIQPDNFSSPLTVLKDEFEFRESKFDILTPKKIVHEQFRVKIKDQLAVKDISVTFEYGNFSRPDVEVKSDSVKK